MKTLGGSCELLILCINGGDVDLSSPDETLSTDSDLEEEDVGTDTVTFKCILRSHQRSLLPRRTKVR